MFVLDASVALKWFLVEPETPRAREVARAVLRGDGPYFVPELFYYEVFAVLARRVPDITTIGPSVMRWLARLPLRRTPMTDGLSVQMTDFVKKGLTGYDAGYAALAQTTNSRWLTYDRRASNKLGNPSWIVQPV